MEYIQKCIDACRNELKSKNKAMKAEAVLKLVYVDYLYAYGSCRCLDMMHRLHRLIFSRLCRQVYFWRNERGIWQLLRRTRQRQIF